MQKFFFPFFLLIVVRLCIFTIPCAMNGKKEIVRSLEAGRKESKREDFQGYNMHSLKILELECAFNCKEFKEHVMIRMIIKSSMKCVKYASKSKYVSNDCSFRVHQPYYFTIITAVRFTFTWKSLCYHFKSDVANIICLSTWNTHAALLSTPVYCINIFAKN